jgi:glucokinase
LKAEIEQAYGLPVYIDNDANAAGLAEALWGAAAGYSSMFYATIGTGIGTGIVINGHLLHGRTGAAAEGGHVVIDYRGPYTCGCGKSGCIEALASGPAIARRAQAKVAADVSRGAALLRLSNGDMNAITAEMVGQAWHGNDPLATEVLLEVADALTVWLGSTIDLLEPEVIVIGGGVGELISNFFEQISSKLPEALVS